MSTWKTLPRQQISNDYLWELTRNSNSFLVSNQGATFSRDPLNLSGLNLKRDSGIANTAALGINTTYSTKKVNYKKVKKVENKVLRFNLNVRTRAALPKARCTALKVVGKEVVAPTTNNCVYSTSERLTARAVVKVNIVVINF